MLTIHLCYLLSISAVLVNLSVIIRSLPEFSFEILQKMRLIGCAYFYPDVFNLYIRCFEKFARLLQSEIIYILYDAGFDFFFKKMLETWGRQINRHRQITDNQLLGDVVFDLPEYLLYPVIHPFAREENKSTAELAKAIRYFLFSISIGNDFFGQNVTKLFSRRKKILRPWQMDFLEGWICARKRQSGLLWNWNYSGCQKTPWKTVIWKPYKQAILEGRIEVSENISFLTPVFCLNRNFLDTLFIGSSNEGRQRGAQRDT